MKLLRAATSRWGTHLARIGLAAGLLLGAATIVGAQQPTRPPPLPDSVRAAITAYRAAVALSDSCRAYPEVLADSSLRSVHSQHRRDPATGRECWTGVPADLHQPIAYVVDGRLVCPSLRPSEWGGEMRGLQPGEILRLEISRDSSTLARVRCAVPAFGLIWITTNRPPGDTVRRRDEAAGGLCPAATSPYGRSPRCHHESAIFLCPELCPRGPSIGRTGSILYRRQRAGVSAAWLAGSNRCMRAASSSSSMAWPTGGSGCGGTRATSAC